MDFEPAFPASDRPLRVLVIDDHRDSADTLAALTGMWGYEVRTAYDGASALAAAEGFRPDLWVIDIGMPRMDGYAVARTVRQRPALRSAKLVALTAWSGEPHQRLAREAGFDHYLTKPADPADLKRMLTMLAQALKLCERTEALAHQNVELARETRELLLEVKDELKEVRDELRDVKEELREVKEDRGC
jgi:CheY-like chemotaxis protein